MYFSKLSKIFSELENVSSRLEKIEILANFIKDIKKESPDIIDEIIYLSQGRVGPFFLNIEFNIGNSLILKSIAEVYKLNINEVELLYEKEGDLGNVFSLLSKNINKSKYVSIQEVFDTLKKLSFTTGKNSTQLKIQILSNLLLRLTENEGRFILRILVGKLRLGFSDKTIIEALAKAVSLDKVSSKISKDKIIQGYYRCSDLGYIGKVLFEKGEDTVEKIKIIPFVPIFPKLVERASSVEDIFSRIKYPLMQPKYDGLRAQIHIKDKKVEIFSRQLENLTEMFPDIVDAALKLNVESLIIDTEAIGYDIDKDIFFPFQETIQRRRKYDVTSLSLKIPIVSFAFDVLYFNGEDLTSFNLSERLKILKKILDKKNQEVIKMSESIVINDQKEGSKYFMKCVNEKLEGIIAKDINTYYKPGTRNFEWIKLKKASVDGLNDTIDCVVLGYYFGYGQRSKFGIGAILVGVYNSKLDRFESIAKIGTGIKDIQWKEIKDILDKNIDKTLRDNVIVDKNILPNVLVEPLLVIEVKADEITKSKSHTAGRDKNGMGYSLRFPRLISIRFDKGPTDITTVKELKHIVRGIK